MTTRFLYYCPLGYLYRTRLQRFRGVIGFSVLEAFPLSCALVFAYSVPVTLVAVAFVGYLSCYECGYLWNDLADSGNEHGGDRLGGLRVHFLPFIGTRVLLFGLAAAIVVRANGASTLAAFILANGLVLALFFAHTSHKVRATPSLRVVTFTALAFYKYLPVMIAVVPWAIAWKILPAIFACYGFPRVVSYLLRKFGVSYASASALYSQAILQFWGCLLSAPLIFGGGAPLIRHASGPVIVWSAYTVVSGSTLLVRWMSNRSQSVATVVPRDGVLPSER